MKRQPRNPAKKRPKATMKGTKRKNSPGLGGDMIMDRKLPTEIATLRNIRTSVNMRNTQ